VENRLSDLYHLVTLASPGLLGTPQEFRTRHAATYRAGPPRNLPELRSRLRDVMVRHRRSEVALMLPRRLAETRRVVLGEQEAELYRLVSARVREHARGAAPSRRLALSTVQRLAGSSPAALGPTLVKLGWDDLAARADGTGRTEKGRVLLELLGRHGARGEQVVVFTAFRRTLEHLSGLLREGGLPAAVYHGSLSRPEKARAIEEFRAGAPILLTTEPAGEGRNLQFCHVMVNFDLPWNPMQIEQRLGRIHRIGQEHDVVLTNLVGRGTVEDHMLRVLEAKINLFELVVGELDMILGRVEDEFDFESFVFSAYVQSEDDGEFRSRLESLGDDLARARASYAASREQLDVLVGEPDDESNGERVG
jgi:SNF2 family DNA or RNA helicase